MDLISVVDAYKILSSIASIQTKTCASIRVNNLTTHLYSSRISYFSFQDNLVRYGAMFRCLFRFSSIVTYYIFDDDLLLIAFNENLCTSVLVQLGTELCVFKGIP